VYKKPYKQVAEEILTQLGGNSFLLKTGSRKPACLLDSAGHAVLQFHLSENFAKDGINMVWFCLIDDGTYLALYWKDVFGENFTLITRSENLSLDALLSDFSKNTGIEV